MFDDIMSEILKNGKRIKKIRKTKLHCTQSDLSSKDLSRAMITMLENSSGKNGRNLSSDTAKILANNMNNYASNNKIVFSITAKELMKDELEQAQDIINYSLEYINILIKSENTIEQFTAIFNRVNSIISKYNIPHDLVFKFYILSIDYSLDNNLFHIAKEYVFECLTMMETKGEKLNTFLKLGKVLDRLSKHDDVIYISNFAISLYNELGFNEVNVLQDLYYILALAYKDTGNYKKCYETIKIVNDLGINFLKLDTLYANCLYDNKKYLESENNYKFTLKKAEFVNDSSIIFRTQQNLALLYLKIGEINKSIECINLAKNIKCHRTISELAYLYYYAFSIDLHSGYGKLKIKASFDEAISKSNSDLLKIKLFNKIIDYYINQSCPEDIMKIINDLEQRIINKDLSAEKYFHIFNKAAKYFSQNNQINITNIILQKSMNLSSDYIESELF